MQSSDIQPLVNYYHWKIKQVNLNFKRYLFNRINWDARIIGIKGARGVGKTTILLQRIFRRNIGTSTIRFTSLWIIFGSGTILLKNWLYTFTPTASRKSTLTKFTSIRTGVSL